MFYNIIPVALPILLGAVAYFIKFKKVKWRNAYTLTTVLLTSIAMWGIILLGDEQPFTLFHFTDSLNITFNLDGLGKIFAGLIATLWPLTVIYSFEYMKHEQHLRMYNSFFMIAMGVTLGIAMSGNMLTMYFFYELLTLSTLPLVIHNLDRLAMRAGRAYLSYSIGGAAFAFIGMAFMIYYGNSTDFVLGGLLTSLNIDNKNALLFIYVLSFIGFGVKAAIFPLHGWLPKASVAPTPVTALLHAVAVVKAGAFAIIRLTYYNFGADFLKGTWAQAVVMIIVLATILFGSAMALKQVHFKRRMAYSTIANLSYILFGVVLMSNDGLKAGILHMLFHSIIKIGAFFAVGAVIHNTGKEYVFELNGLGKKMPVTFACFTVFGLALAGIPPFNGFISKWQLAMAALDTSDASSAVNIISFIGICVLLISALLTAIYMLNVAVRAFFPSKDANLSQLKDVKEVSPYMTVPMILLALMCVVTGLCGSWLIDLIGVALGI